MDASVIGYRARRPLHDRARAAGAVVGPRVGFDPRGEVVLERGEVRGDRLVGQAEGIAGRAAQERDRRRGEQQHAAHAFSAMPREMAHDLPAREGVGHDAGVVQVEGGEHVGEVVGERVEVEATARVRGAAVGAAVVGHAAEAAARQRRHLVGPGVGRERPAGEEHERPAPVRASPVAHEEIDAVAGADGGGEGLRDGAAHDGLR